MKIDKLNQQTAAATGVKKWMISMFTLTQVALVSTLFLFMTRGDSHRETLVPPVIHQTFWIDEDVYKRQTVIHSSQRYHLS